MMNKKLLMELIILENLFLLFLHLILSEVEKIHLQYIYIWVFLINIKYESIYRTLNKQTTNKRNFFFFKFHYYSKSYTNKKGESKDDNKGIKLIKEFIETLYKEMTEERNKRK